MIYRGNRFGRVMSKMEYSETERTSRLYSQYENGLIPVFGCPPCVEEQLERISRKSLRDMLKKIGVRNSDYFVVFNADRSYIKAEGIPMRNGSIPFIETKLVNGIPIDIVKHYKL